MNKFVIGILLRLTLFLGTVAGLNYVVFRYIDLYAEAENEILRTKFLHYKKCPTRYNTLFIGSSKVGHQIIPRSFDSSMSDVCQLSSFNFGVPGLMAFRNFTLLRRILEVPNPNLKFIVMESSFVRNKRSNLFSSEFYFSFGYQEFVETYRYLLEHKYPPWDRIRKLFDYSRAFLYRNFFPGVVKLLIKYKVRQIELPMMPRSLEHSGYNSLETEFKEKKNTHLKGRRLKLLENQEFLKVQEHKNRKGRSNLEIDSNTTSFCKYLEDVYLHCTDLGIRMIYLIPPGVILEKPYKILRKSSVLSKNIIDLGDPKEYPEFYDKENFFDLHHFNDAGAELYTAALSEKFKKFINRP